MFRAAALLLLLTLPACHAGRLFLRSRLPARPVAQAGPAFQFCSPRPHSRPGLPGQLMLKEKAYALEDFLRRTGTVALLVIRHDTLVQELYREGYAAGSALPSFSVAKPVVAALVGVAIEEKHIGSVDDPIRKYLPELDAQLGTVTLRHLLQMRSGVAFSESYLNPFGGVVRYYRSHHLARLVGKLRLREAPDQRFDYQSVNALLLGMAVARATGRPLAQYLQEKIWQPLGMEYDASWSLDRPDGTERSFCCLNARARDYAKLGRLYLHHGQWQGRQVLPRAWVEMSVDDSAPQAANEFRYSYQWWHHRRYEPYTDTTRRGILRRVASPTGQPLAVRPVGDFYAQGALGQLVYVNPAHDFILVRLGRKDNFNWAELGRTLAEGR